MTSSSVWVGFLFLGNRLFNSYIPPCGVILHIGVRLSPRPMCKMTTPLHCYKLQVKEVIKFNVNVLTQHLQFVSTN